MGSSGDTSGSWAADMAAAKEIAEECREREKCLVELEGFNGEFWDIMGQGVREVVANGGSTVVIPGPGPDWSNIDEAKYNAQREMNRNNELNLLKNGAEKRGSITTKSATQAKPDSEDPGIISEIGNFFDIFGGSE